MKEFFIFPKSHKGGMNGFQSNVELTHAKHFVIVRAEKSLQFCSLKQSYKKIINYCFLLSFLGFKSFLWLSCKYLRFAIHVCLVIVNIFYSIETSLLSMSVLLYLPIPINTLYFQSNSDTFQRNSDKKELAQPQFGRISWLPCSGQVSSTNGSFWKFVILVWKLSRKMWSMDTKVPV